jgi:hypothetical protein
VALAVLSPPVEGGTRLSYSPAEAGASVTAVRLYDTPARTGVPVFQGVPTLNGGVWTFSADLEDGDYYSAFDVTDSTGAFTDDDDFFYVLSGEVVPGSQVVSMAEVRAHLNLPDKHHDAELVLHVAAAVEVLSEYVGSPLLPTPVTETHPRAGTVILRNSRAVSIASVTDAAGAAVPGYSLQPGGLLTGGYGGYGTLTVTYVAGFDRVPAALRLAVLIVAARLWETQRGAQPLPVLGGDEDPFTNPGGLPLLPPRAETLLAPYRRSASVA